MITKWLGWDKAGLLLSVSCMIHCLATPFLPTLLGTEPVDCCCSAPDPGWTFHSVALIFVMAVALMVCVRCSCCSGWGTVLKLLVGLGLMWAPQLSADAAQWETAFTVSGALLVGWAHWNNLKGINQNQVR